LHRIIIIIIVVVVFVVVLFHHPFHKLPFLFTLNLSTNATFPLDPFHQTGKGTPQNKNQFFLKRKPNTIHRHTTSERLPKENAID
jgi:hypothetical protein